MSVNLRRYWFLAFIEGDLSPVYIGPAKNMKEFCKKMASANPKLQTRPATWSDLHRYMGIIKPDDESPTDRAHGILTFRRERRLVSIWPL